MTFSEEVVAIIPARGSSKRLPGKNIKLLNGKPLISYSIKAAQDCPFVDACYVSSDDGKIAAVAAEWGANVIRRPVELATDVSSCMDVVFHALDEIKRLKGIMPRAIVLLQPTSPLRTAESLSRCLALWGEGDYATAVSLTLMEHHPYKVFLKEGTLLRPLFNYDFMTLSAQELPEAYRTNGAIYVAKTPYFLETRSFFAKPLCPFFMPPEESIDIDTILDFRLAELLLRERISDYE